MGSLQRGMVEGIQSDESYLTQELQMGETDMKKKLLLWKYRLL